MNSNGRFRLLNVLTARARSAEDVDLEVGGIDLDFDRIVDFGIDVDGRERRVTAGVRIKRALAHETVNPRFGAQRPVGPFAFDKERGGFDPGDVAGGFFFERDLEALAFGVAHVHALEHARPVLGFGAARARLNFKVAVRRVHRLVEHALEFELSDFAFDRFDVLTDGFERFPVLFGHGKFKEVGRVVHTGREAVEAADDVVQELLFLADFLGVFRIVPKIRIFHFPVYFFESARFAIDVKDTSEVRSGAGADLPSCSESD